MIPVIGIVGYSNAGKTTLVEKIIRELRNRGYRVGTVKHHHKEIDLDTPGKDTWRHAQAGAQTVVLASPTKFSKIETRPHPISLEEILPEISGVDIILVEGFKKAPIPKIEVFRSAVHRELVTPREELLAVASDTVFSGVLCYGLEDTKGLVDLIEEKVIS